MHWVFLWLSSGDNTEKKQYRKRIVIQLPANGGQDCPEVLTQERECGALSVCQGYRYLLLVYNTYIMLWLRNNSGFHKWISKWPHLTID